jgi:hypothetical protein
VISLEANDAKLRSTTLPLANIPSPPPIPAAAPPLLLVANVDGAVILFKGRSELFSFPPLPPSLVNEGDLPWTGDLDDAGV